MVLRLLEVEEFPLALQQGTPNRRNLRAEADLRDQIYRRHLQTVQGDRQERAPIGKDDDRHCEVGAGRQPTGDNRENQRRLGRCAALDLPNLGETYAEHDAGKSLFRD